MTEHDDRARLGGRLLGPEEPALGRRGPQQREQLGGHGGALDSQRLVEARDGEPPRAVRGDPLERSGRFGPGMIREIAETRAAQRRRGSRMLLGDADQPVRVRVGKGAQQHAVDDREDRRVGADPERERDECRGGEAFVAPHGPQGESGICNERLQPVRGPGFPDPLPDGADAAERALGGAARLVGRHPTLDVLLGLDLDVGADLRLEIGVAAAEPPHDVSSSRGSPSTRPTAPTSLAHLPVSATSFFRPVRVSL